MWNGPVDETVVEPAAAVLRGRTVSTAENKSTVVVAATHRLETVSGRKPTAVVAQIPAVVAVYLPADDVAELLANVAQFPAVVGQLWSVT